MDNSKDFQLMLDKAIKTEPSGFVGFDRTKNVQDQLQEMVFDSRISAIVIAHELFKSANAISKISIGRDMKAYPKLSMEQLWLAFCMAEKFNKVWDGESWIAKL